MEASTDLEMSAKMVETTRKNIADLDAAEELGRNEITATAKLLQQHDGWVEDFEGIAGMEIERAKKKEASTMAATKLEDLKRRETELKDERACERARNVEMEAKHAALLKAAPNNL